MDIKIPLGIRNTKEIEVGSSDSANTFGSGRVNVFATPAMIALMESAALDSIESYLPDGFTTVGTEVNIKHLKATPMGYHVKADSYLKSFEGRKLVFELHAWDNKGLIGIGTHTRVVVDEKEFMSSIK